MSDQYEITIVKYGTRSTHKSDVYLNYSIYGTEDDPIDMDYFFWVLRNSERTVLVDTGFSPIGGSSRQRTFLIDPVQAFEALGVDPAAPQTIIVTHAHYDHIGNLSLFPTSQIVITRRELEFWTGTFPTRAQYRWSIQPEEVEALGAARSEGRVKAFEGRVTVAPGIDVIEVGGHTPGQAVVRVQTIEGTVLLASDAAHYLEEVELDRPFAFVSDLQAMYAGFDLIRGMLTTGAVKHVVPGHDPGTLARFRPVESGPLAGLAATIGHYQAEEPK